MFTFIFANCLNWCFDCSDHLLGENFEIMSVFISNCIGLELEENLKLSKSKSFIHTVARLLHCLVCVSPGARCWQGRDSSTDTHREDGHENRLNEVMQVP